VNAACARGAGSADVVLPSKGLYSLPFMRRKIEAMRQAAEGEAREVLREIEAEEARCAGDGDAGDSGDEGGGVVASGRLSFGGAAAAKRAAINSEASGRCGACCLLAQIARHGLEGLCMWEVGLWAGHGSTLAAKVTMSDAGRDAFESLVCVCASVHVCMRVCVRACTRWGFLGGLGAPWGGMGWFLLGLLRIFLQGVPFVCSAFFASSPSASRRACSCS
jgi:hypothetical protein